jgi:hypothetical protein
LTGLDCNECAPGYVYNTTSFECQPEVTSSKVALIVGLSVTGLVILGVVIYLYVRQATKERLQR